MTKKNEEKKRDACEVCKGERGGVPGNENRVDGKLMCDYCHADYLKQQTDKEQPKYVMERKKTECARSRPLTLRHLRQIVSAVFSGSESFRTRAISAPGYASERDILATAKDTSAEYSDSAKIIDDFYKQARNDIGGVKIYLIAEAEGWTKSMRVEIKGTDEDELSLAE